MAKILFLDSECNSLDTELGFIQELAWAIYDSGTKRLLKCSSHILDWGGMHYDVEPGALQVTGLSKEFCQETGRPAQLVFEELLLDLAKVDAVAGHNIIEYDLKILNSNIKRSLYAEPTSLNEKFIFHTIWDCPYENPRQIMSLKYLAYDHGFILTNAHEALADVLACAHVFFKYPFKTCYEIASTPLVTLHGYTVYQDEEGREAFYRQKFRWNRDNRRWEKKCRAYYIPGTQLELKGQDLFMTLENKEMIIRQNSPDASAPNEPI